MSAYQTASAAVIYVSALVPWAFVLLYHRLSRGAWARDPMGWHIMAITAVDGTIFTMLGAAVIWPQLATSMWFMWPYLAVVAGIPVVTIWRAVILWRLWHPPGGRPLVPGPPVRPRRRLAQPLAVWQTVLAAAQVVNLVMLGHGGVKVALLVGAAQLGLACFAHGRASAASASSA